MMGLKEEIKRRQSIAVGAFLTSSQVGPSNTAMAGPGRGEVPLLTPTSGLSPSDLSQVSHPAVSTVILSRSLTSV